jgi:cell division protein FtsZ
MKKNGTQQEEKIKKIKIKVLGLGGGGINIVSHIFKEIGRKISFLVLDTDRKCLKRVPKGIEKIYLGKNLTKGFGTGMDLERAKASLFKDKNLIEEATKDADLVLLIASLGGGTGSVASEFLAKLLKKKGKITFGIFTLPFSFEGKERKDIAKNTLFNLKKNLNSFLLIQNDQIFSLFPQSTPLSFALFSINKKISEDLSSLLEVIFQPSLINIDFADLKTVFEGRGKMSYLNFEELKEEIKEQDVDRILNNNFLPYSIDGAKEVLFHIFGGEELEISKINFISNKIYQRVSKNAKIIFGVSKEKIRGKRGVLVLGVDCKNSKLFFPEDKKSKKRKIKKEEKTMKKEVERKNGLSLQKEKEKEEAKILAQEEMWQVPTFLRKGLSI